MMKSVYSIFILLFLVVESLTSQQLPLFSQYRTHAGLINPSLFSNDYWVYNTRFLYSASYRRQWTGFEASPKNMNIQGVYITQKENSSSSFFYGGAIQSDKIGRENSVGLLGRLGIIQKLSSDENGVSISSGFLGGVVQYALGLENASAFNSSEPFTSVTSKIIYPDLGFGFSIHKKFSKKDNLDIGFSIPQLFGIDLTFNRNTTDEFQLKKIQHYYGNISFTKTVKSNAFEFSSWIKYVKDAPVNVEINLRFHYKDWGWLGFGYNKAGILCDFAYNLDNKIRVGYGVGEPSGSLQTSFGITHEFNIGNGIRDRKCKGCQDSIPNVYLLVVGISDYASEGVSDLKYPERDVSKLLRIYESKQLTEYYLSLESEKATKSAIIGKLNELVSNPSLKSNDMIIFFYSGHGLWNKDVVGICPYEFNDVEEDLLDQMEIIRILEKFKGNKVCIIESCRDDSYKIIDPEKRKKFQDALSKMSGTMTFIRSSDLGQESVGRSKDGAGIFSKYIIQGLEGKANSKNPTHKNLITIEELFTYVRDKVKKDTNGKQVPQINPDYPRNLPIMFVD